MRRDARSRALVALLTVRQQAVLRLCFDGYSAHAIGARLGISHRTVETHRARAYLLLGVGSLQEAWEVARDGGLIAPTATRPSSPRRVARSAGLKGGRHPRPGCGP